MPEDAIYAPSIAFPIDIEELLVIREKNKERYYGSVANFIYEAIRRLPEPRVYLCEPAADSELGYLWDQAYDIALTLLIDRGEHVVDARMLSSIVSLHTATQRNLVDLNPYLWPLIENGHISSICVPGNMQASELGQIKKRIRKSAHTIGIRMYEVLVDDEEV